MRNKASRGWRWLRHHVVVVFVALILLAAAASTIDEHHQRQAARARDVHIRSTQVRACERANVRAKKEEILRAAGLLIAHLELSSAIARNEVLPAVQSQKAIDQLLTIRFKHVNCGKLYPAL